MFLLFWLAALRGQPLPLDHRKPATSFDRGNFRSAAACRRFGAGSLLAAAAASRGSESCAKALYSKGVK
jgi:hypothetical protein